MCSPELAEALIGVLPPPPSKHAIASSTAEDNSSGDSIQLSNIPFDLWPASKDLVRNSSLRAWLTALQTELYRPIPGATPSSSAYAKFFRKSKREELEQQGDLPQQQPGDPMADMAKPERLRVFDTLRQLLVTPAEASAVTPEEAGRLMDPDGGDLSDVLQRRLDLLAQAGNLPRIGALIAAGIVSGVDETRAMWRALGELAAVVMYAGVGAGSNDSLCGSRSFGALSGDRRWPLTTRSLLDPEERSQFRVSCFIFFLM